jgi:MFS family permease
MQLFEAPSNMVLKQLRPRWYLAALTFAWGMVATFSAFVQDFAGLVACRLLLGLFEAGLFPGLVVYLTIFYNKRQIALRTAYLFATAAISGAAGGLVAYAIGFLDNNGEGTAGWRAWRWMSVYDQYSILPNYH